ncbi:CgeB family protein [Chthonobacter rhizosphaerae]|uniref:CgeB family protein n=1 Tax=Chthonobacter rhizosphaerae TaxID=2735553 RepID=UPI0015EE50CC|nr:glycosyltransferase [Chthonobacter rhizosphaerae]
MNFVFYIHSLVSDWNHGNAHFVRGVLSELVSRGHQVVALEPVDGWSRENLVRDQGEAAVSAFYRDFPDLLSVSYGPDFDHEAVLADADVVVVHEWTDPALVARIGRARDEGGRFSLLFHDTHHRAVSAETDIAGMELAHYDGVLAFGETLRERYLKAGWGRTVYTWHEAADTRRFRPLMSMDRDGDLVWIGNWGDDERTAEIHAFLIEPVRRLGIRALVHGVRYPDAALTTLEGAGIRYGGWLPNAKVPEVFSRHVLTVHIPRRPYVESLPGIPTIRMFEALACGIPLISAPWDDAEGLFRPGEDFLFARDGEEMERLMRELLADTDRSAHMAASGLATIEARHTCRHRVDELFAVLADCGTTHVKSLVAAKEAA